MMNSEMDNAATDAVHSAISAPRGGPRAPRTDDAQKFFAPSVPKFRVRKA
jgi:hypothetical protein